MLLGRLRTLEPDASFRDTGATGSTGAWGRTLCGAETPYARAM
jgi:hypothetical protein